MAICLTSVARVVLVIPARITAATFPSRSRTSVAGRLIGGGVLEPRGALTGRVEQARVRHPSRDERLGGVALVAAVHPDEGDPTVLCGQMDGFQVGGLQPARRAPRGPEVHHDHGTLGRREVEGATVHSGPPYRRGRLTVGLRVDDRPAVPGHVPVAPAPALVARS